MPRLTTSRKEMSEGSSLMTRSFMFHAGLLRLCGCLFIRGFGGGKKRAPRVVWKSWYTIYSCACLAFMIWNYLSKIIVNSQRPTHAYNENAHSMSRWLTAMTGVAIATRALCNFVCAFLYASRILNFYERASSFEKYIGMAHCSYGTPRRFLYFGVQWACACSVYCFIMALTLPYLWQQNLCPLATRSVVMCVFSVSKEICFRFLHFTYATVHSTALQSSFLVLTSYVENQLRALNDCTYPKGRIPNGSIRVSKRLNAIMMNLSMIRRLKDEMNSFWSWSLVISIMSLLIVSTSFIYSACFESIRWKARLGLFVYVAVLGHETVMLASSSQSLINAAKKIKRMCANVHVIDNISCWSQIQRLHASIDPERMGLKCADFCTLKLSLLVSIASTIATYAMVLLQTSPKFGSHASEGHTGQV